MAHSLRTTGFEDAKPFPMEQGLSLCHDKKLLIAYTVLLESSFNPDHFFPLAYLFLSIMLCGQQDHYVYFTGEGNKGQIGNVRCS